LDEQRPQLSFFVRCSARQPIKVDNMKRGIAIAVVLGLAGVAHAKDPLVVMYGVGGNTCGDFLADRAKNSAYANSVYASYIYGFITGTNQFARTAGFTRQVQGSLTEGTVLAVADKYCRENPQHPFASAINTLIGSNVTTFDPDSKGR
jgi:hypothetical protein